MGCDIHAMVQAKKDGQWVDVVSDWEQDRHYFLFAWLADVRNGFGFAGSATHRPIKPIAERRGLPDDFEVDGDEHKVTDIAVLGRRAGYLEPDEEPNLWMGDHSHSWLTFDEILSAPQPDKVWTTGIVPLEFFEAWDGHTQPDEWSGMISGPSINVAESPVEVDEKSTHVRIFWIKPSDTLKYFIDEIQRLKNLHGEGRIVFGFDS